jgi:hypothetical protein
VFIPTIFAPAFLATIIGVFDLTIAVHLAFVATLQSCYIPHTFSECQNAETWQVSGNGTLSFFHVASTLGVPHTTAEEVCQRFVLEWQYSVALM